MPSSSSNSSPQTGGVVSPYLLVLIPNTRLMSLAWSWWFIIYLCTSYCVLLMQITGLFYYVKVIILCSCCTPRPTALRSCALGADCLHQSLRPQSVVTHSGKALWRVWIGMATSMYVTFFSCMHMAKVAIQSAFIYWSTFLKNVFALLSNAGRTGRFSSLQRTYKISRKLLQTVSCLKIKVKT